MTKQSAIDTLYEDFQKAQSELQLRNAQLNFIEPDNHHEIDAAIYLIRAAEVRFEKAVQQLKEFGGKAV